LNSIDLSQYKSLSWLDRGRAIEDLIKVKGIDIRIPSSQLSKTLGWDWIFCQFFWVGLRVENTESHARYKKTSMVDKNSPQSYQRSPQVCTTGINNLNPQWL
jgi:hypothetical protein